MNCSECNEKYGERYTHEVSLAMAERTIKRLWILAILLIVVCLGTNIAWIVYESQFEVVETVQEVVQEADGNGDNHFVGGNFYGTPESYDKDATQNP